MVAWLYQRQGLESSCQWIERKSHRADRNLKRYQRRYHPGLKDLNRPITRGNPKEDFLQQTFWDRTFLPSWELHLCSWSSLGETKVPPRDDQEPELLAKGKSYWARKHEVAQNFRSFAFRWVQLFPSTLQGLLIIKTKHLLPAFIIHSHVPDIHHLRPLGYYRCFGQVSPTI